MKGIFRRLRDALPTDGRQWVRKLLPHTAIVISGMLVVFFVIDRVNKPMGFMTNEFHKVITFILALIAIWMAIRVIAFDRRAERAAARRQAQSGRPTVSARPRTTSTGRGQRSGR